MVREARFAWGAFREPPVLRHDRFDELDDPLEDPISSDRGRRLSKSARRMAEASLQWDGETKGGPGAVPEGSCRRFNAPRARVRGTPFGRPRSVPAGGHASNDREGGRTGRRRKQVALFLPLDDWTRLRDEAARRGVAITELCRQWLRPALDRIGEP